uniref:sn-1-specific diacylglycerol lipase n=1 Tax=Schistocephalus solidus TaxID=70667 RepID=A0A0X3NU94_SCHSO
MPSLKLFRRTWKYAEDDFVSSSLVQAIIRFSLILAAGIVLLVGPICISPNIKEVKIILGIAAALCLLEIILFLIIAGISAQGGALEVRKRRLLPFFVGLHLFVLVLELVSYCLSIWQMVDNCTFGKSTYSNFLVVICWCSILLFVICFEIIDWIRHFDKNGALKYKFYQTFVYGENKNLSEEEKKVLIEKFWNLSKSKWTNFIRRKITDFKPTDKDGKQEAIEEAATTLADVFMNLDLTFTDMLLGLTILRWQTTQWIGGKTELDPEVLLCMTDPVTNDVAEKIDADLKDSPMQSLAKHWLHIDRLQQYAHFVDASYGWLYYSLDSDFNCTSTNRLCKKLSPKNKKTVDKQRNLEEGIDGPGGCLCAGRNAYLAAFLEMSGLIPQNILIFDIANTFYDVALMLVLDDKTRAIVIIVRGTLSGDDTLTDLLAVGEPLREEDEGLPEEQRYLGHGGMVRVSRNVVRKIIEERWVEKARKLRPDYPVVLCGHSLGAGLVSLMSVLLKPVYPELKAYAFSPPGALMNERLSESTRDYLCSIIYGYDVVGRLGAATIEDLRARLFHALCVCNVPKFRMLGSRLSVCILNMLMPCCKSPPLGKMDVYLTEDMKEKLVEPDLDDVYASPEGSFLEPYKKEVYEGASKVDRLLPSVRTLMSWKKPTTGPFLRLPRPYPRKLYPEELRHADSTDSKSMDQLIKTLPKPRFGARILHILEVESEFQGFSPMKTNSSYVPPPIAYWADPRGFMSILVHPKMLKNHSPTFVTTAIDRLHAAITSPDKVFPKFPLATYRQEAIPLRNYKRPKELQTDKYCRIRKPKNPIS